MGAATRDRQAGRGRLMARNCRSGLGSENSSGAASKYDRESEDPDCKFHDG